MSNKYKDTKLEVGQRWKKDGVWEAEIGRQCFTILNIDQVPGCLVTIQYDDGHTLKLGPAIYHIADLVEDQLSITNYNRLSFL